MASRRTLKLNSGYTMPVVGLGTWVRWKSGSNYFETEWGPNFPQQSKKNEVQHAVTSALQCGYRHIDAAAVYGNEAEVGEGIKASGVPREDIFVSKVQSQFECYYS